MEMNFRTRVEAPDLRRVEQIARSTGFFREDEIDVAVELVAEALEKGSQASGYFFVFAEQAGQTLGFACYGPTPCTLGTFDLYWIVVEQSHRGMGWGMLLLQEAEKALANLGARKLYIETSSQPQYATTRNFYLKAGYTEEARLNDFYQAGDDKVIFARYLNGLDGAQIR